MKTLISLFFVVLIFSNSVFAQSELAIVSYNIGVDVKESKNLSSHTLTTLQLGELFLCEPTNNLWLQVQRFRDRSGFVKMGNVKLVKDLAVEDQTQIVISSLLKKQNYIYMSKDSSIENAELQKFFEQNEYEYILEILPSLMKKSGDADVLTAFLEILVSDESIQNQIPQITLGEIYINNANLVLQLIDELSTDDQKKLKAYLKNGFEIVSYAREEEIVGYEILKSKLVNPTIKMFSSVEAK